MVFELLGLSSEHVCKVPECHARGDVAGGDEELGTRIITFGVPGGVSATLREGRIGQGRSVVAPKAHAERCHGWRGDEHAAP